MSMSTNIIGIRDLDGKFDKMMKVKLACDVAEVDYPKVIYDYFINPNENEEYLREKMQTVCVRYEESGGDSTDIFEVHLSELPEGVKSIRFMNFYD